jgi:8-oxo-dGTP diphosphatase
MSEALPPGRKVTEVAVGVLLRPDGAVLLADRPAGKPYAGYWEFPGGKIERGETVEHALARELHEELGIDIGPAAPWVSFEFDYPHAYVRLHFCRIDRWRGVPHGREGQQLRFFRLDEDTPAPLLPAAVPALRWLALPTVMAEATVDDWSAPALLAQIDAALAQGLRMLLLRGDRASLDATKATTSLIADVVARAQAYSAHVVIGSGLAGFAQEANLGLHLDATDGTVAAAAPGRRWVGTDADSRAQVEHAARRGCDYVLAGPLLPVPAERGAASALGWHGFARLAHQTPIPVYAAGGLSIDDLPRARAAGAHGVALPLTQWGRDGGSAR